MISKYSNLLNNVTRCHILDGKNISTIEKRLIYYIELVKKTDNIENKKAVINQAIGASEIAVEYGLITYKDFEIYIHHVFRFL